MNSNTIQNLPEKWCILQNSSQEACDYHRKLHNSLADLKGVFKYLLNIKYNSSYYSNIIPNDYMEITVEQFKKYVLKEEIVKEKVIEPLPQFKIIETIETITKVENNEGSQFFIGDIVKTPSANIYNIKGFKYNVDKTNILAILSNNTMIGIDKIEHYIEPKVVEETLLEKAKRLYPIGTKFRVACIPKYIGTVKDHKDYPFQDVDIVNLNTIENIDGCTGMTVFYKGKWAEIINE
jgi:hypothetical protein